MCREPVPAATGRAHGHHASVQSQAISITFAARAQPDAPRRFSGVAYSGGVIPHYGWLGDVAIDLSSLNNAQGEELPVLVDHDQRIDAIAGRGCIFKAADADGLPFLAVEGEITQATEAGRKVAALLAEGHPVQLSVGMHANVREIAEPLTVNGRALKVNALFENAVVRELAAGDIAGALMRHADRVIEATAIGAGVDRAWLEEQTPDALIELASRVLEVNADFFVARVLPQATAAAQRLSRIASGGTSGSPPSSMPGSGSAT